MTYLRFGVAAVAWMVCGCSHLDLHEGRLVYFVSPQGDDANSGGRGAPFRTLEHARERVRRLNHNGVLPADGVTVMLREGRYAVSRGFVLDARDSGQAGRPVVYRAFPGETVTLTGGLLIAAEDLATPESAVVSGLPASAAAALRYVDLAARGVDAIPDGLAGPGGSLAEPELFLGGAPLPSVAAVAAIAAPGQWSLDRAAGRLYLWPPRGLGHEALQLAVLAEPLLVMDGTEFITWQGFTMECTRSTAAVIQGGRGNRVVACTIRHTGGDGLQVDGSAHAVVGCDIAHTGGHGLRLSGGDRRSLTASENLADNNHVHHTGRRQAQAAGILVEGVGSQIRHNLLHDLPAAGIQFAGNDHGIESNELLYTCLATPSSGALYSRQDWTSQGNVLRGNSIHHIAAAGICLDDGDSGETIEGNTLLAVERGVVIGGGRDHAVVNNLFIDCPTAVVVDDRCRGRLGPGASPEPLLGLRAALEAVPWREAPWTTRYPHLAALLEDDPELPLHNRIARNLCVGAGASPEAWLQADPEVMARLEVQDNLNTAADPGFAAPRRLCFRLRKDAAVWGAIPGFVQMPSGQSGLYRAPERAAWPVERPLPRVRLSFEPRRCR